MLKQVNEFRFYELFFFSFCSCFIISFGILINSEGETFYHPLQSVYLKQELQNVGRDISNYEVNDFIFLKINYLKKNPTTYSFLSFSQ